ncbi:MAG TPA: hypothetical protein VF765_22060 [Polyangiaceae bacterium]
MLSCALGLVAMGCGGAAREEGPAGPVLVAPIVPPGACPRKPEVAANPPVPAGWVQVKDAKVTPEMAAWAADVVNHGKAYPMCSSTLQTFGVTTILARVEWHPPDFNVETVHRGVTLYERDTRRLGAALDPPAR